MTTDVDGNYRGAYTYANGERVSVEDLGQVEGKPNNPLYYLSDALGSTIAITNMNAGIIDSNRFGPYGEAISPVAKNARLTNSPWGFTGESHDIEGGLIYLRARYYEPETGRFLNEDSYEGQVNNPLTLNRYIYCGNNPILYIDPSGHFWKTTDKKLNDDAQAKIIALTTAELNSKTTAEKKELQKKQNAIRKSSRSKSGIDTLIEINDKKQKAFINKVDKALSNGKLTLKEWKSCLKHLEPPMLLIRHTVVLISINMLTSI